MALASTGQQGESCYNSEANIKHYKTAVAPALYEHEPFSSASEYRNVGCDPGGKFSNIQYT